MKTDVLTLLPLLVAAGCADDTPDCTLRDGACPARCVEVRSATAAEIGLASTCLDEGTLFGCAPDPATGFYGDQGGTGLAGVCTFVRATETTACFTGTAALWWYFENPTRFCGSSAECGFAIPCAP